MASENKDNDKVLISFDIGIKNLAVCVLVATNGCKTAKILVWKIISLAKKTEKIPNLNEAQET